MKSNSPRIIGSKITYLNYYDSIENKHYEVESIEGEFKKYLYYKKKRNSDFNQRIGTIIFTYPKLTIKLLYSIKNKIIEFQNIKWLEQRIYVEHHNSTLISLDKKTNNWNWNLQNRKFRNFYIVLVKRIRTKEDLFTLTIRDEISTPNSTISVEVHPEDFIFEVKLMIKRYSSDLVDSMIMMNDGNELKDHQKIISIRDLSKISIKLK